MQQECNSKGIWTDVRGPPWIGACPQVRSELGVFGSADRLTQTLTLSVEQSYFVESLSKERERERKEHIILYECP